MRISKVHSEKQAVYDAQQPKQFGTVHERMKFLLALANGALQKHPDIFRASPIFEDVRQAILDLESEVAVNDCDPKSRSAGERQGFVFSPGK